MIDRLRSHWARFCAVLWDMAGRYYGRARRLVLFAVIGAGAVLAVTAQGPISVEVLMMELTGHDRACAVSMVIAVGTATVVARTIDPRSNYDVRFTNQKARGTLGLATTV